MPLARRRRRLSRPTESNALGLASILPVHNTPNGRISRQSRTRNLRIRTRKCIELHWEDPKIWIHKMIQTILHLSKERTSSTYTNELFQVYSFKIRMRNALFLQQGCQRYTNENLPSTIPWQLFPWMSIAIPVHQSVLPNRAQTTRFLVTTSQHML